jgi:hypothetical protein
LNTTIARSIMAPKMEPNDDMHDSPQDMPNSQLFVMSSSSARTPLREATAKAMPQPYATRDL